MAYTYFKDEDVFHNDIEEYINGYLNSYEITEAYKISKVIGAVKRALELTKESYIRDSGWNKITILSAQHVVEYTLDELEEEFPEEEYPELWI